MSNWEYKGIYKKYNMDGIIDMPNNSKLMVCDLMEFMPDFMLSADTLFIDPPCSQGNLQSFYTKADKPLTKKFNDFDQCLFSRIEQIYPKHLFLEVFASNYQSSIDRYSTLYDNLVIYDSFYYNKRSNKCWILHFSNNTISKNPAMDNIDEEKVIKYIANNHEYDCIGDLCMGTGLVGKYAYLAGKRFVGTELNKKRLAVLIERINKYQLDKSKSWQKK